MCGAKSLPLFRGSGPTLSVLVPTGDGDSEDSPVAYSTSVYSAELDERKKISPFDILAVLGALASLALCAQLPIRMRAITYPAGNDDQLPHTKPLCATPSNSNSPSIQSPSNESVSESVSGVQPN